MKTDNLHEKRISLGKCIIHATDKMGIYTIDNVATVAAVGPNNIMTGDFTPNGDDPLCDLNENLIGREVALIKEFVLGALVAYKIVDLSDIKMPSFLDGNGLRLLQKLDFSKFPMI